MKKSLLMPMKLQFFAEQDGGSQETMSTETTETTTDETKKEETGKTFSRDELAKIVAAETKKAVTAAEEKWRAEKDKAAKHAEMTPEEKIQDELAEKDARIAEFERKEVLSKMSEQASEMLSEKGATPTKEMLRLIVSEDAETTSSNVKTYLASVEAEREAIKAEYEKRLGGKVPLDGNGATISRGAQLAKNANNQTKKPENDPWAIK